MPPHFPDPALSANIYCSGLLDRAISQAIVPFWKGFQPHDPDRLCYLWLVRYGAGGEHLKVRVHGPGHMRPFLEKLLEERVAAFLGSLPELVAAPPLQQERVPAIDAEDGQGPRPDRTLLWTTYRRSDVSLGGKPLLSDDRYAALLTRCLAAGCEVMLLSKPDTHASLFRQRSLLWALITGLAALDYPAEKRAEYLAYHRDWLLRSLLPPHLRFEAESVSQLHHRLDERIAQSGGFLQSLQKVADTAWSGGATATLDRGGPEELWPQALADLLAYVSPLCQDPTYRLDPFASDPAFAPLFKAFHGFANQLGLRREDEAFLHHALLRITTP